MSIINQRKGKYYIAREMVPKHSAKNTQKLPGRVSLLGRDEEVSTDFALLLILEVQIHHLGRMSCWLSRAQWRHSNECI